MRKQVDEATKQAKAEPEVEFEELTGDINVKNYEPHIRGVLPNIKLKHINVGKPVNL